MFVHICYFHISSQDPWDDPFHTKVAAQIKQTKTHILMNIKQQRILRKEIALEVFTLALEIFQRELQSFGKRKISKAFSVFFTIITLLGNLFTLVWGGKSIC